MKSSKLIKSLLLFSFAFSSTVLAEVRIAVVDLQKALSTSKAGSESQKRYEAEVKKSQGVVETKKKDFEKQQEQYKQTKDSLNNKAKAEQIERLTKLEKDAQRAYSDNLESLQRLNQQLVGELFKKLRVTVEEIAKEKKINIVLEKGGAPVLYADATLDITEEVVKKFDQKN